MKRCECGRKYGLDAGKLACLMWGKDFLVDVVRTAKMIAKHADKIIVEKEGDEKSNLPRT